MLFVVVVVNMFIIWDCAMKKLLCTIVLLLCLVGSPTFAGQKEFCDGFKEGYKAIKGDMVMVPMCPLAPLTPLGSNDYREGLKAGMDAARK